MRGRKRRDLRRKGKKLRKKLLFPFKKNLKLMRRLRKLRNGQSDRLLITKN